MEIMGRKEKGTVANTVPFISLFTAANYCGGGTHTPPEAAEALVSSQISFTCCCGGVGGVMLGAVKSKNSVMSAWAASLRVRFGRLNRFSTNLRTAV